MSQLSFESMALAPAPSATRIKHGMTAGDRGVERSIEKAERTAPGWTDRALEAVRMFARNQGGALFTVETMRWVIERDLPKPPDLRSWGAITRMATSRGFITKTKRTAPTASSNGSDRPLYHRGPSA